MLGNLDAKRDWGHAKEFVEAMWLINQQKEPDDYVIATGKTYTVRMFVELAFREVGIEIIWEGEGESEVGKDKKTNKELVKIDKRYFRPSEVEVLLGDPSKAQKKLGWEAKISLQELVSEMVNYDLKHDSYHSA